MKKPTIIGAVAYDPKVVTIWEGIREYFKTEPQPIDFVLFSNYEAQVEALFDRFIDVAWNTNLAFVKTDKRLQGRSRVLAMRDTDLAFTSKIIVNATSAAKTLSDLRGQRVAFGSHDSAQANIMPDYYLRTAGLIPGKDYQAIRFNTDVGKHGDTGRSELDVMQALVSGEAGAGAVGETTWAHLEATGGADKLRCLWTSPPYSHCNFTALPDIEAIKAEQFIQSLLQMDYNNPAHRPILEMEGLKQWLPGKRDGYAAVFEAAEATDYLLASIE